MGRLPRRRRAGPTGARPHPRRRRRHLSGAQDTGTSDRPLPPRAGRRGRPGLLLQAGLGRLDDAQRSFRYGLPVGREVRAPDGHHACPLRRLPRSSSCGPPGRPGWGRASASTSTSARSCGGRRRRGSSSRRSCPTSTCSSSGTRKQGRSGAATTRRWCGSWHTEDRRKWSSRGVAREAWPWSGAKSWSTPPFTVAEVDPVGAGDAFAAGYLAGHLWDLPAEERLRVANAMGALSVATLGDYEGLPDRDELRAFLEDERVSGEVRRWGMVIPTLREVGGCER